MSDIKKVMKLTEEQQELFTSGNMIVTGEERYYNFPYWLKDLGSGDFEIIEHTIDVSKAVRSFMEECQVDYSKEEDITTTRRDSIYGDQMKEENIKPYYGDYDIEVNNTSKQKKTLKKLQDEK